MNSVVREVVSQVLLASASRVDSEIPNSLFPRASMDMRKSLTAIQWRLCLGAHGDIQRMLDVSETQSLLFVGGGVL